MNMEVTGQWLFDSLLVTTLLMAAILFVRRPVAKLFGASVAYALWLIPAARLMMPSLEGAAVPVAESGAALSDPVRHSILAGIATPAPVVDAVDSAAKSSVAAIDLTALGVTFWLGGAALFFIVQMIRYASMRDDLLSDAKEIATIDGVKLVASDQVAGPLAFGLFKRFIAVPQDFTKTYSPAERELAIAHEMAHHKSGDLFANLVAFSILCLQWFNPVAWMSWSAFRFDQEAACDARVLAGKGAEERAIYGQALARTAFDGVPTFATALNSPKTIIERLRRLTMKDASFKRRVFGKLGIITAGGIILPLSATVVPAVTAQDASNAAEARPEPAKKTVRVIQVHEGRDVADVKSDSKFVKKIERDGKTIVLHSDKEISEAETEQMISTAEAAQAKVEKIDTGKLIVMSRKMKGDAEALRIHAEKMGEHGRRMVIRRDHDIDVDVDVDIDHEAIASAVALSNPAAYVPHVDIREVTGKCANAGHPVSTDVSGFDGHGPARVKVVMCGKGQARIARAAAIDGLRDARRDVSRDKAIPADIRKDVVEKLDEQIRRLEAQVNSHS